MLERTGRFVARLLDMVVGGLLAVVVVVTLAQVAARYLLDSSLIWSEEFNRLLYIWLILLAAVKPAHMRIGLFVDNAPAGVRRGLQVVSTVVQAVLLGLIVYGAWAMYELSAVDHFIGLDLSVKWMYLAPLVGGVLMLAVVLGRCFGAVGDTGKDRS